MTRKEQIKDAAIARFGNNGNESQYMLAKVQAFMVGARWADEHPDGNQIKWQTGIPKENGVYLVTMSGGYVAINWYSNKDVANDYFKYCVIAWCKLSDIEPYKEKENQP